MFNLVREGPELGINSVHKCKNIMKFFNPSVINPHRLAPNQLELTRWIKAVRHFGGVVNALPCYL